jgi:hypothetical protein
VCLDVVAQRIPQRTANRSGRFGCASLWPRRARVVGRLLRVFSRGARCALAALPASLREGRRGGGAHQPGPGWRYRVRPSARLSSRASSVDTAHLRISWESRTLRCTSQSLSTRAAPMAALELLPPSPRPFATVCRLPARVHGVLRSSPRKSRAPSPRTSELAYHLLRHQSHGSPG